MTITAVREEPPHLRNFPSGRFCFTPRQSSVSVGQGAFHAVDTGTLAPSISALPSSSGGLWAPVEGESVTGAPCF